jgi:hypothetical protein
MARPRKKAQDLTTDEALAKLFPKKAVNKANEEAAKANEQAAKANEQATKKDSKP